MEHALIETALRAAGASPSLPAGGVPPQEPQTVAEVLEALLRDPGRYLVARWNWKSAVLSSSLRASIFFFTNLVAGWHAALGAMLAELALRSLTSGFYGAVTEAFSTARPAWAAMTAAMLLLPFFAHSLELLVHWMRHTPKLGLSIATSVSFTAVSTAFNLYAMRRGALTVGHGSNSLRDDLRRVPRLILDFLIAIARAVSRSLWKGMPS
jgi:hypothetical protein